MSITQLPITLTDGAQIGLGFTAIMNVVWAEYLSPAVQASVAILGLVLLYYTIRKVRSDWLLNQSKLKREKADEAE